jgi:hypothetical protein
MQKPASLLGIVFHGLHLLENLAQLNSIATLILNVILSLIQKRTDN